MASPLQQFEIQPYIPLEIGGYDISFSNASLWMSLAVVMTFAMFGAAMRRKALVPGRWQNIPEMFYEFVAGMVRDTVGQEEGRKFFPFVFTIFIIVLMGNLLGLVPYSFTYTSHIVVTGALALLVFGVATLLGFIRHGFHFLSFFVPPGVHWGLWPIMIPIEVMSYLSRPISLSVRLCANMMAGHTMLKVFAGFSVTMGALFGLAPMLLNTALFGLELIVALLQAYVFALLTCMYLKDSIELH